LQFFYQLCPNKKVGFPLTTFSQPIVFKTIAELLPKLMRLKAVWISGTSATFGMHAIMLWNSTGFERLTA
jgi:hypothetical protein